MIFTSGASLQPVLTARAAAAESQEGGEAKITAKKRRSYEWGKPSWTFETRDAAKLHIAGLGYSAHRNTRDMPKTRGTIYKCNQLALGWLPDHEVLHRALGVLCRWPEEEPPPEAEAAPNLERQLQVTRGPASEGGDTLGGDSVALRLEATPDPGHSCGRERQGG